MSGDVTVGTAEGVLYYDTPKKRVFRVDLPGPSPDFDTATEASEYYQKMKGAGTRAVLSARKLGLLLAAEICQETAARLRREQDVVAGRGALECVADIRAEAEK